MSIVAKKIAKEIMRIFPIIDFDSSNRYIKEIIDKELATKRANTQALYNQLALMLESHPLCLCGETIFHTEDHEDDCPLRAAMRQYERYAI